MEVHQRLPCGRLFESGSNGQVFGKGCAAGEQRQRKRRGHSSRHAIHGIEDGRVGFRLWLVRTAHCLPRHPAIGKPEVVILVDASLLRGASLRPGEPSTNIMNPAFLLLAGLALPTAVSALAAEPASPATESKPLDYVIVVTGGELLEGAYPDGHTTS